MHAEHSQKSRRNSTKSKRRRKNRLRLESLESRRLLAAVTVGNANDVVNGDVSSISALIGTDGGDGISLREAITAANNTAGADDIDFDSLFDSAQTISLTSQLPTVTDAVAITGPGASLLTIDAGGGAFRVLEFNNGAAGTIDVSLSGVTLTGGNLPLFPQNTANFGGAIFNAESLTVSDSEIIGNNASLGGGIYSELGSLTVEGSLVADNRAGFFGGGINVTRGTADVTRSTISNNEADSGGFFIAEGGGIAVTSADGVNASATLHSVTVTGNTSEVSGSPAMRIFTSGGGSSTVNATNSIFTEAIANQGGTFTGNHNLFPLGVTATTGGVDDITSGSVLLNPLEQNNGPTRTHALLVNSPALNIGSSTEAFDQRGQDRDDGRGVDMGAFEAYQPVFVTPPVANTTENQVDLIDVDSTDGDEVASEGGTLALTYSLTGGADQARFAIEPATGVLTFVTAPDYENPTDSNGDNIYEVEIRSTDNHGHFQLQDMVVTVTPNNDIAPVFTSPAAVSIPENTTVVQDLTATDADDVLTVPLVTDGSVNDIDMSGLEVGESFYLQITLDSTGTAVDSSYGIVGLGPNGNGQELFFGDGLGTNDWLVGQDLTAFVTHSTGAPVTAASTTLVLKATNAADGQDTFTWWINPDLADTEDASTPAGTGTFTDGEVRDIFGFQVVSQNSTPTASDAFVHLSGASPFLMDSPTSQDLVITIDGSGDDNDKFELVDNELRFITAPDFEMPTDVGGTPGDNIYVVNVLVDDQNGLTTPQTILVSVDPVNDNAPIFTSPTTANVAENTTLVHDLTATDADLPAQTVTFSISGAGADNAAFELVGDTLQFVAAPDFENPTDLGGTAGDNIYEVTVLADDGEGMTTSQTILVTVDPVNDNSPVFTSPDTGNVDENTVVVHDLAATDADLPAQTVTFSIAGSGADNAAFELSGNTLQFIAAPDFEAPTDLGGTAGDNIYEVTVVADDGAGLTTSQTILVTVDPVNEDAPVITSPATANVAENTTVVHELTATDSDLPAQTVTFSIAGAGADNAAFEISGNTLQFIAGPDFESPTDLGGTAGDNVYEVTILADDGNGLTTPQTILVTVDPVNDNAPVFTSPATQIVSENTTLVHDLAATDSDLPAQTVTFTIAGAGADNAAFELSGSTLQFISAPDFEAPTDLGGTAGDNVYEVTVVADDGAGMTTPQTILVTVGPVNDGAPVFTSPDTQIVNENTTEVHELTATDSDVPSQTITFTVAGSGADNAAFEVSGNTLQFITAPDFEAPTDLGGTAGDNIYEVTVVADDGAGSTTSQTILVTVADVDDTPPVLVSFERFDPSDENTNADTLVFRATFSEEIVGIDPSDFTVSGTTATVTGVAAVAGTGETVYEVTVSGGDLATVDGEVSLNVAAAQNITDVAGNPLASVEPAVDEPYQLDNTAPTVSSVVIGDGTASRSAVRSVTVNFDSPVVFDAGAFALTSGGSTVPVATDVAPGVETTQVVLTFPGTVGDSLADGNYTLTIDGALVRDAVGNDLDGDGNGSAGGNRVDDFFRFYGDTDGDRDVDGQDYGRFGLSFLQTVGDASFNSQVDFDNDGDVDGQDYGQFGLRFLQTLAP